jgi:hypothetical protein
MKTHFALFALAALLAVGCNKPAPHKHDHSHDHAHPHEEHSHNAPHGGTVVVLGKEEFHIELVHNAAAKKVQAFVLDGEMRFVRVKQEGFVVMAKGLGRDWNVQFKGLANAKTGEAVGDTSAFEAEVELFGSLEPWMGVLQSLEIRGKKFEKVSFKFPEGNDPHVKAVK